MTETDRNNQQRAIRHWRESAEQDWETAQINFDNKRYNWALYIAHLAIEKLLKAVVVKAEKEPPYTHNLVRLADLAELDISQTYHDCLIEMRTWNMEARYDDEKLKFYKKADRAYTQKWFNRAEEIIKWLKKQLD